MTTDTALINSQIDIRQIAESAGAEFRGNRSTCPVHGGDNPAAFEIWDGGNAWTCHTRAECNAFGHDGIALLRALNNWTFSEVKERYTAGVRQLTREEQIKRDVENAERIEKRLQKQIEQAQKAIEDLRRDRRWIQDHENMSAEAVRLWEARGIPEEWQHYWWLGYRQNFNYEYSGKFYTSPSLTIPIFGLRDQEPRDVKHRLINPVDPSDRYRHDRAGLKATPFLGDRDLPLDVADRVIVVEGEIKAAVTMLTLDKPLVQVIGIQGKEVWGGVAKELEGRHDTIIMLDPDAKPEAVKMARSLGGARVVDLPAKVDDMIIEYGLDKHWLESVFHNSRMVV